MSLLFPAGDGIFALRSPSGTVSGACTICIFGGRLPAQSSVSKALATYQQHTSITYLPALAVSLAAAMQNHQNHDSSLLPPFFWLRGELVIVEQISPCLEANVLALAPCLE